MVDIGRTGALFQKSMGIYIYICIVVLAIELGMRKFLANPMSEERGLQGLSLAGGEELNLLFFLFVCLGRQMID